MNKRTVAITRDQYDQIIDVLRDGWSGARPNVRVATALVLEANLGLRISDILQLRLNDIIQDGGRYRLDIAEIKTGKIRVFTVPTAIYNYIRCYCIDNDIKSDEIIFDITERAIQKALAKACDYLGLDGISTHSLRKFFATEIYKANDYNIALVQQLLQHSSPATTQKYIGIQQKQLENALQTHIYLK